MVVNTLDTLGEAMIDPYLQIRRPKSMLCLSLASQQRVIGVLYMESGQMENAFVSTPRLARRSSADADDEPVLADARPARDPVAHQRPSRSDHREGAPRPGPQEDEPGCASLQPVSAAVVSDELTRPSLLQLQNSQGALEASNRNLETKVADRTIELRQKAALLQAEVAEKERAQAEMRQAKEVAESATEMKSQFLGALTLSRPRQQ